MRDSRFKAVTLMEVLVAIVLLGVVIVALNSINTFSHFQVISSGRRARVQNEVFVAVDHIGKQISATIGNEMITGTDSVVRSGTTAGVPYLAFRVDTNNDGSADQWRGYRNLNTMLQWCPNCATSACTACNAWAWGSAGAVVSNNITGFQVEKPGSPNQLSRNYVDVTVEACFKPGAGSCGSSENPTVNMTVTIKLPSVSTN